MRQHRFKGKMEEGFSLIELLLVIFIVSLVYFLGFSTVQKQKESLKALSPKTLKKTLLHNGPIEGTFICTKACTQCYFRKDINAPFEPYSGKVDLKDTKAYTLNSQNMLEQEELGRFQDEKICLQIRFYANGSSTPLVIESKEGIYYLPSYFGNPVKVDSLEKAKSVWLKEYDTLRQYGAFF